MTIVLTFLCLAAVAALLFAEATGRRNVKLTAKPLASACFVGIGAVRWARLGGGSIDDWLLLGLFLGAVGDQTLMLDGRGAFLGGLCAFLLGHVAYVAAFATLARPGTGVGVGFAAAATVMVAFGIGVLRWLWSHLGSMRLSVVVYVAVICSMVVAATVAAISAGKSGGQLLTGAVLFAVSDLAVARERFVRDAFVNKAWGLPLYYAGQLCLAWAVGTAALRAGPI